MPKLRPFQRPQPGTISGGGGGVGEVVESGYTDIAGDAAGGIMETKVIPVSSAYDPAKYYPVVLTVGEPYSSAGVAVITQIYKYWQDFGSSQIKTQMNIQAGTAAHAWRFYWEVRKIPDGCQLYQAVHNVAKVASVTTPEDNNITLNTPLRSATKHMIMPTFRGQFIYDTGRTLYARAPSVRVTGIQQATWNTNWIQGAAGKSYDIPIVIIH
jgi:hypothetical protein